MINTTVMIMSEQDKINLFRTMIAEYMLRKSDEVESDRLRIINRISVYSLSSDDYYDLLVNSTRDDTTKTIFREIKSIIDIYLR